MDAGRLQGQAPVKASSKKRCISANLCRTLDELPPDSIQHYLVQMELHKKFSIPFACLIMALMGLPLGMHAKGGKSWGVAVALVVFLGYYLMLSAAWSFGETGDYPPAVGMWGPELYFGGHRPGAVPPGGQGKARGVGRIRRQLARDDQTDIVGPQGPPRS